MALGRTGEVDVSEARRLAADVLARIGRGEERRVLKAVEPATTQ
jgi:antitoxin (DNA-binding transcriptional repressor) of toxin-antitoxin stability system